MKITKRQLRRIIKEQLGKVYDPALGYDIEVEPGQPTAPTVDPHLKKQLISWWNGIREPGEKYTWREIRDDVMATLPESGHGVGLTRQIESMSLEEVDDLFQSVFAGGRWRKRKR
jgi:hypothetical protein